MDLFFKKIDKNVDLNYLYSIYTENASTNVLFKFDNILFEFTNFNEIASHLNIDSSVIEKLWLIQYIDLGSTKEYGVSESYSVALCLPSLNTYNSLIFNINNEDIECLIDKPTIFLSSTPARFKIAEVPSIVIGFNKSFINISEIETLLI